jgi:Uma2 family endonuclease
MLRCIDHPDRPPRFDVIFLRRNGFPDNRIPDGDVQVVPDLVVDVLSSSIPAYASMARLEDALEAAVPLVWVVNPTGRTIRVYRAGMTTRLFRCGDVIENEPLLPGFRLVVGEVFPERT